MLRTEDAEEREGA